MIKKIGIVGGSGYTCKTQLIGKIQDIYKLSINLIFA